MKLPYLQQKFLSALCNSSSKTAIEKEIVNSEKLPILEKIAIYGTSMRENLIKKLRNTYPVCFQIVGDDFFRDMAEKYSKKKPSVSFDLGNYGADFAGFIAKFLPAQSVPYLSDITKLEWLLHQLSRGKNTTVFDFSQLKTLSPAQQLQVVFELPPNSFLLKSLYPIKKIWEMHQPDYKDEFVVNFNAGVERLFLYNNGFTPRIEKISNQEWLLLKAIKQGKMVAELVPAQITLLPSLVERDWLAGFHISN